MRFFLRIFISAMLCGFIGGLVVTQYTAAQQSVYLTAFGVSVLAFLAGFGICWLAFVR